MSEHRRWTQDRIAIWVSLLSLLMSVVAVVFSGVQLSEDKRQFRIVQSEQLHIAVDANTDGPIRVVRAGQVVQLPWAVTLSNTGNQKLSVTDLSMSKKKDEQSATVAYSGMNGGFFRRDLSPLEYPLTLEPGDSQRYVAMVGVLVPQSVSEVLLDLEDSKLEMDSASLALAKQGLDVYGNAVTYSELGSEASVISVDQGEGSFPTFRFRAVTGRGNVFESSGSAYRLRTGP